MLTPFVAGLDALRRSFRPGRDRRSRSRSRRLGLEPLESRALLSVSLPETTVQVLRDINTANSGSAPAEIVNVAGTAFFAARSGDGVTDFDDLWKSNGMAAGTTLVKETMPYTADYQPDIGQIAAVGNSAYYLVWQDWGDAGDMLTELFVSDGTAAGTKLLRRFRDAEDLTAFGGKLFFRGEDRMGNAGIWASDGTTTGTVLLKPFDAMLKEVTASGTSVYFSVSDALYGDSLWQSNGTSAGTVLVKQFTPGTAIGSLLDVNGTMFLVVADDVHGEELWTSNGTDTGTVLVKDIAPNTASSSPRDLANINGTLYFRATDGVSSVYTLWKSTGTAAGTTKIKDLAAATGHSYSGNWDLTEMGGSVYFLADNGGFGQELWTSNGTAAGTVKLTTIDPGQWGRSKPDYSLEKWGSELYFVADNGGNGRELWKTNGTAAGTSLVADLRPGLSGSNPEYLTSVQGNLFFRVDDGVHGQELYTSNGTVAGTVLVKEINATTESSEATDFTAIGSSTLFFASDSTSGQALWKTDGTAATTSMVKDIRPGDAGGAMELLTAAGGGAFFIGDDGLHGSELWYSDGTTDGTWMVRDIYPGVNGAWPSRLTYVGGTLYFVAHQDMSSGPQVWRSNGAEGGTSVLKSITPNSNSMGPDWLTDVQGTLYFTCDFRTSGGSISNGLWKSDGSEIGTVLVHDFGNTARMDSLTSIDGVVYFKVQDIQTGARALWKSDAAGTTQVHDFGVVTGESYGGAWHFAGLDGMVYLLVADMSSSMELWRTNGTEVGTSRVMSFTVPVAMGPFDLFLESVNGSLYFRADNGTNGTELWRSDGTAGGTTMVADLIPGKDGSNPKDLSTAGGMIFFTANGPYESELYVSDGTAAGTVRVRTQFSVPLHSPQNLKSVNGMLYFTANDRAGGSEPWLLNMNDVRAISAVASGQTELTVTYEIVGGPVAPFEIGFYRSDNTTRGTDDVFVSSVPISAAEDLAAGTHIKTFTIGVGPGRVPLPAAGVPEVDTDYFLLAVADHLDQVPESDATPGADNVAVLTGAYHAAGGPVMVHAGSTNDVIRVLPGGLTIEINGATYTYTGSSVSGARIRAHGGNDDFQFTVGDGFGTLTTLKFLYHGGSGTNSLRFWGSTSATKGDSVTLCAVQAQAAGQGYTLSAKTVRGLTAYSDTGPDVAVFYDSSMDDTFEGSPTYALLRNTLYTNRAEGFPKVYCYGSATGFDTALFTDTTGDGDKYSGSPTYSLMTGFRAPGKSYYVRANGFERAIGESIGGADTATLADSFKTTTATQYTFVLDAALKTATVTGNGVTSQAIGFRDVTATTMDQATDRALIYDTPETDIFRSYMSTGGATLTSGEFSYRALRVNRVEAFSEEGGADAAYFYDSAGDDTFSAWPNYGQMAQAGGATVSGSGFRYVYGYSDLGGTDQAALYGIDGKKDYYLGNPSSGTMSDTVSGLGTTYYSRAEGFDTVEANARMVNGRPSTVDQDQATFYGSAGVDTATAWPTWTTHAGLDFSNTARMFRYVYAYGAANDIADFWGVSSADTFLQPTPDYAIMSATDYRVREDRFGTVNWHPPASPSGSLPAAPIDAALTEIFGDDPDGDASAGKDQTATAFDMAIILL